MTAGTATEANITVSRGALTSKSHTLPFRISASTPGLKKLRMST